MINKYYIEEKVALVDKWILFTVMAMLALIPIITYNFESISISPVIMNNFYGTGEKMNVFNFYKSILLYIGSFIIFLLTLYKFIKLKQDIKETKINIIITIFIVSIIMSLIFTKYKDIALLGNFDRNEGALAWFCYLIIFFALYNINIDKKYIKYFYYILIPFLIINLFLVLVNFYGYDILKSNFIQTIIGGHGRVSGTFWTTMYHFNFMSGIAAVIFGVSFTYLLLEEDNKQKVVLFLGTIISFTIVLLSNSIGGFLTSIVIIPIILPIVWKFINKKQMAIWSLLVIIVNFIIYTILNKYNPRVYEETFVLFEQINNISSLIIPAIIIAYIALLFILSKLDKKKTFKYTTIIILLLLSILSLMYSHKLNKENKLIEESKNKTTIVKMSDSEVFKKLNELSTDRLNIWTKTIDLINDRPLLGHGFDTFPYIFIPNDINNGYSTYGEIIDKPHNWYLSVAYGSGIFGLVSLLGVIIYIIKGMVYKFDDKVSDKYIYIYSIGCIAFFIQGIFNDSLIGTSTIFWIFAGLAVNRIHKSNI